MPSSLSARVRKLLLGSDPAQQLRASQALLVLLVYAAFAAIQHLEVVLGMIDAAESSALTAWNLSGSISFYAAIRSDLNLRLDRDRALGIPQSLWAIVGVSWSYAITGPARGAVILVMVLVIMFGMFALTPTKARVITGTAFTMLGSVMVWKGITDPDRYDPRVEGMHLAFAGIVLAAASAVTIRIGKLRASLEGQRAELKAALERNQALASRDDLTGLLNRRAAMDRLHGELRQGDGPPLCVALIDLDHFKRINDSHGHAAGDGVLRRFAELARAEVRASDRLARWGGEEFLLMMPGADRAQGMRCLQRIRDTLRTHPMHEVEPGLVVTFSAGLATCSSEADLERAIERADAAMYRAKEAGRDCALEALAA